MSAEILNSEVNKIMDFFLVPDHERETKDKLLKSIDNELEFSDDVAEKKNKSNEDGKNKNNEDEFFDAEEENNEDNSKPKNEEEEVRKSIDILSLNNNEDEGNESKF